MSEPVKVYCVIMEERERSVRIIQEQARGAVKDVFIPRSQIEHKSKNGKQVFGGIEGNIEIPEWLAEEKGLDYE